MTPPQGTWCCWPAGVFQSRHPITHIGLGERHSVFLPKPKAFPQTCKRLWGSSPLQGQGPASITSEGTWPSQPHAPLLYRCSWLSASLYRAQLRVSSSLESSEGQTGPAVSNCLCSRLAGPPPSRDSPQEAHTASHTVRILCSLPGLILVTAASTRCPGRSCSAETPAAQGASPGPHQSVHLVSPLTALLNSLLRLLPWL